MENIVKFASTVTVNGKCVYCNTFYTLEDAKADMHKAIAFHKANPYCKGEVRGEVTRGSVLYSIA